MVSELSGNRSSGLGREKREETWNPTHTRPECPKLGKDRPPSGERPVPEPDAGKPEGERRTAERAQFELRPLPPEAERGRSAANGTWEGPAAERPII